MDLKSITVIAPVKLNLNLHIIGVNQNHYHLLEGVTVFATDGDVLHIAINDFDVDTLSIHGAFAEYLQHQDIADNLVIKAIKLLRTVAHFPFLNITLEKNIPIQAGYGGGSSDAAAVLKGINDLCHLNLSQDNLSIIGQSLGADVPMCLYAKPCFVYNIGDKITPITLENKQYACLLLKPHFMLSTPDVFNALVHKNNLPMPLGKYNIHDALMYGRNDLWQAAVTLKPELHLYLQALQDTNPIKASMSGSGSGLFALYHNDQYLDNAYEMIQKKMTNAFIMKTIINV